MMTAPVLLTARLRLRRATLDDLSAFQALTASEAMRRHLTFGDNYADTLNRILRHAGSWSLFGYGNFLVERRDSGAVVGTVGPFRVGRGMGEDFDHLAEVGWIIAEDQHGQGYAREAAQASLTWMFDTHGLQPLGCMIADGNIASERVAASLGFTLLRHCPDHASGAVNLYRREPAPITDTRVPLVLYRSCAGRRKAAGTVPSR